MSFTSIHRRQTLAALYSGCDIYLCPSWDEGLGMPPMEAMACGAALVTYDNGGCRDYARDGETALVAKRRDVDDLAAKLEQLAARPELRARLAAAGSALVTTAFDWDRAVERLEGLFRKRTLVRVQPDAERVDLLLEPGEALGQSVVLLTECFGQRDHRVDQPTLAVVGGRSVGHGAPPRWDGAPVEQFGCRAAASNGVHLARLIVRRLTA